MRAAGKIAIGVAAAAVVIAAAGAAKGSDNMTPSGGTSDKVRIWRKLEWIDELSDVQRFALMLIARREGGYSPGAHNGSASERAASEKAANNNPSIVTRCLACGIDESKLHTGSWSTFQLLAPYYAGTAFEVFGNAGCTFADPTRAPTNLNLQIALAIEHARDLQGYKGFQEWPTIGNLYLGWGSPSRMGGEAPTKWKERLDIYRALAKSEKFPAGIVDAPLNRFPSNPAAIYEALRTAGPP